jgi:hypothetical protein
VIAVEYLSDLRKACADPAPGALLAGAEAPFDRAEWWEGLVRYCGLTPLYVLARGPDGMALVPLARIGNGVAAPLANWYSFRWRPLVSPGADATALLAAVFRDLARHHWRLALDHVPAEDGSATLVAAALREAGWRVTISQGDINHVLPVAGRTFAEYLAARPGPLRSTLKRKGGRVACEVLPRFSAEAWAAYEAVYAASWKGEEGSPAFLRAFAEAEGEAGRLRLGIARVGGEPVAAQLWTVEAGTAFIHKLAYREDARAFSPGTALTAALMTRVIDEDHVDLVDFGTGDDAYKRDWMEQARPRFRVLALKPADPRTWAWLAGKALRRLAPAAWRG